MDNPKAKIIDVLSADENRKFHTHIELLDACLGRHGGAVRAKYWVNGKFSVWMPKIQKDRYGNFKPAASGWINYITADRETVTTVSPSAEEAPDTDEVTLIFAMLPGEKDYTFLGAYMNDVSGSFDGKTYVLKRVAKKVEFVGNPCENVKLLDEE